jgi:ankyrin repeat protein
LLIKVGAKVDVIDYAGHTLLFCAARDGNLSKMKVFKYIGTCILLVEEGKANVNVFGKNNLPNDFDDQSLENEDERFLVEGLKCAASPLHVACLLGYLDIVCYLLEKEANPNTTGLQGYNSLHFGVLG